MEIITPNKGINIFTSKIVVYYVGSKAVKRDIKIGRQNPQYYKVLEGLEPGEKVITSGYDNYGDNDVLILK